MKIGSVEFLTSAKDLGDCPESKLPEVAFIGRSNVGKSSLVNMLTKQKDLAKVSSKPGKTKMINFFRMEETWHLVDLPGYGYAKVSQSEQARFNDAVSEYLMGRKNLKLIFVLIDSRYEPMELDLQFLSWLQECPAPHAIVFTKTDTVSKEKWNRHIAIYEETLSALGLAIPDMLACSSKLRLGRGDLVGYIQSVLPKATTKRSKNKIQLGWLK